MNCPAGHNGAIQFMAKPIHAAMRHIMTAQLSIHKKHKLRYTAFCCRFYLSLFDFRCALTHQTAARKKHPCVHCNFTHCLSPCQYHISSKNSHTLYSISIKPTRFSVGSDFHHLQHFYNSFCELFHRISVFHQPESPEKQKNTRFFG